MLKTLEENTQFLRERKKVKTYQKVTQFQRSLEETVTHVFVLNLYVCVSLSVLPVQVTRALPFYLRPE